MNWESIGNDTKRLRILNGWLVRTVEGRGFNVAASVALIFVADPNNDWKLDREKR